ncbi:hypothetical protein JD844_024971 [Phrynosoma platyrhinos]|uniref:Uncharacterized protein n=1 Tax=Phrynosoma platyrhinos TaxID=52577 RepID=A0ABQ7SZ33_PHRPL|nr:hypothetical protein JD844_024971 [Phrynosoma platyrhinos]
MAEETSGVLNLEKFLIAPKDNKNELLFSYRGVLYPQRLCCAETFEALETMEVRNDDVLIVAYPKCGEYSFKEGLQGERIWYQFLPDYLMADALHPYGNYSVVAHDQV